MNLDNFEKLAKDLFDADRPTANHEEVWQNIEPHLKKKKKRRAIIWFFWGIGVFCLLGLLWWKTNTVGLGAGLSAEKLEEAAWKDAKQSSSPVSEPAVSKVPNPALENKVQTSDQSTQPKNKLRADAHVVQKEAFSEVLSRGLPASKSGSIAVEIPTPRLLDHSPVSEIQEPEALEIAPAQAIPNQSLLNLVPVSDIKEDKKTPSEATSELKPDQKRPARKPSKKERKRTRIFPHALSLHAGMALPLKVLGNNPKVVANEAFLKNRKGSEKQLEAISASTYYTFSNKNGLLLRAGLDYRRLNEKFTVSYTNEKVETVLGVLTMTVDATGQVIAQTMGNKTVATTTIYSNQAYNYYQWLDFPMGVGYQNLNKKRAWELAAGLDLNLFFNFSGTMYNEFGQSTEFSSQSSSGVFIKKHGIGLWASYGYSRNISKNIRWQLSAKANIPLRNITVENYPLAQRYYCLGLQGGLIFNIVEQKDSKHKKR